jgi:aspartyl-tRNA(Asn)/glutamyl-tRNA(Gln) amidotransferase subunit A
LNDEAICTSTIAELSSKIRNGEISPIDLARLYFQRIKRLDGVLKSYITLAENQATEQATKAKQLISEGKYKGPLHGIPVAVKDVFFTEGLTTTYGSKIMANYVPQCDATAIARLKEAGAILIGKHNLSEFAGDATNQNPHFGDCRNPWDTSKIPGGSSGGSAAAVAASLCVVSLGGDTGGSVRIPASLCGVVGLKPTYGRISRYGSMTESWSLDHVGIMARSVLDSAFILESISGHDPNDPTSSNKPVPDCSSRLSTDLHGVKIGCISEYAESQYLQNEVKKSFHNALEVLTKQGATIEEISVPWIIHSKAITFVIAASDAAAELWPLVKDRLDDVTYNVRVFLEYGKLVPAEDYVRAQKMRSTLVDETRRLLKTYNLLVSPTTPSVAPTVDEFDTSQGEGAREKLVEFTTLFNATGIPAISVPCGFSGSKLPIGLQIAGRPFDELSVLNAAYAYEQNTPWHNQHPEEISTGSV